jgi:hypothetical protein
MKFFSDRSRAAESAPCRAVERLELHVTHACNLACDSCSHYSNHGHSGNLDPALADRWMKAWSDRLLVKEFNLLGGEPSIHPRLSEFVLMVRRHWPAAYILIITNGFFLHRHPGLPATLAAAGNCELALSIHHDGAAYTERLRPIFDLLVVAARSRHQSSDPAIAARLDPPLSRLRRRNAAVRGWPAAAKLESVRSQALQAIA